GGMLGVEHAAQDEDVRAGLYVMMDPICHVAPRSFVSARIHDQRARGGPISKCWFYSLDCGSREFFAKGRDSDRNRALCRRRASRTTAVTIAAVDQPNASVPLTAYCGPSKRQRGDMTMSP